MIFASTRKKQVVARAKQQQGASVEQGARVEFERKRSTKAEEQEIEVSLPGAGYVAVTRPGATEPQLIRVCKQLRGATRAREIHGPANSSSDGLSVRREQSSERQFTRRTHAASSDAPSWTQRGMFKSGVHFGQPTLRGAKLFTKGRVR